MASAAAIFCAMTSTESRDAQSRQGQEVCRCTRRSSDEAALEIAGRETEVRDVSGCGDVFALLCNAETHGLAFGGNESKVDLLNRPFGNSHDAGIQIVVDRLETSYGGLD
ncbi:MAG: hypothetical protein ABR521_06030 [Gaiellaceae bacterium]